MSEEIVTQWAVPILSIGLVLFLFFIIWDLGKKSKVGRQGMLIILLVLGLGMTGFLFKELLVRFLSI